MFLSSILQKKSSKILCNFLVFIILFIIIHKGHYEDYFDRAHKNVIVMDSTNPEYYKYIQKNENIQIQNKTFYEKF